MNTCVVLLCKLPPLDLHLLFWIRQPQKLITILHLLPSVTHQLQACVFVCYPHVKIVWATQASIANPHTNSSFNLMSLHFTILGQIPGRSATSARNSIALVGTLA